MQNSPSLLLPYILPSQAQKHVTHNEALRMLDALVQASVESAAVAAPPAEPAEGEAYIVAAPASGEWAGMEERLAAFQDGAWAFFEPRQGWRVWVRDIAALYVFDGGGWVNALARVDRLGISADADATNRLAVSSPATLFNHAGAGHQLKINKNADTDTASLLFQTGWSGRAEMGTAGDDDFSVKVSPDGSGWLTGLRVDKDTGIAGLPQGAHSGQVAIADDAVATIPIAPVSGLFFLWVTANDQSPDHTASAAAFWFDAGDTPTFATIALDDDVNLTTGAAPTGTTGADTDLNIFVDSGAIHLENRRGGERIYRWMLMA